jgi:hypothetical protein
VEEELWVPAPEDEAEEDEEPPLEPPQAARLAVTAMMAAVSESFEITVLLCGRRRIGFPARFSVGLTPPAPETFPTGPQQRGAGSPAARRKGAG